MSRQGQKGLWDLEEQRLCRSASSPSFTVCLARDVLSANKRIGEVSHSIITSRGVKSVLGFSKEENRAQLRPWQKPQTSEKEWCLLFIVYPQIDTHIGGSRGIQISPVLYNPPALWSSHELSLLKTTATGTMPNVNPVQLTTTANTSKSTVVDLKGFLW